MQALRRAHWITRFLLVCWVLFIGAAAASPLVKTEGLQMVCTAIGGMKLVDLETGEGAEGSPSSVMDCPLCMPTVAPSPDVLAPPHPGGLAYALQPPESARLASLMGPPWQARGPPCLTL